VSGIHVPLAWEPIELDPGATVLSVHLIGERWFALGAIDNVAAIWLSDDGLSWTRAAITAASGSPDYYTSPYDVVEIGPALVAIGSWGTPATAPQAWFADWRSLDAGATWVEGRTDEAPAQTIAGLGISLVIVGSEIRDRYVGWAARSDDVGLSWQRVESPAFEWSNPEALVTHGDVLVAVGRGWVDSGSPHHAAAWRSADGGATWQRADPPPGASQMFDVIAVGEALVAVGNASTADGSDTPMAWLSTDGATWSATPMGGSGEAVAVAAVGSSLVAVGNATFDGPPRVWVVNAGESWQEAGDVPDDLVATGMASDGSVVVLGGLCRNLCEAPLWYAQVGE
jgi:hypothetical protein